MCLPIPRRTSLLEKSHQQSKADATKTISALIEEANAIQQTFLEKNDPTLIQQQYDDWVTKTISTLNEKLDPSYAASFKSAPGVLQVPVNHTSLEGVIGQ
jgi:hypothetical protein